MSCERTGIELFFDKKGASEFIRKELASPRGNALKHRHKVLAQAHNDDFAAYLNGLVGFTGERE